MDEIFAQNKFLKEALKYRTGEGVDQNFKIVFMMIRKLALDGHERSFAEMAHCYWNGEGVEEDQKTALYWLDKGLKANQANAHYMQSVLLSMRADSALVKEKSHYHMLMAAKEGHLKAMHMVAVNLIDGYGVQENYNSAYKWLCKAIEGGLIEEQVISLKNELIQYM